MWAPKERKFSTYQRWKVEKYCECLTQILKVVHSWSSVERIWKFASIWLYYLRPDLLPLLLSNEFAYLPDYCCSSTCYLNCVYNHLFRETCGTGQFEQVGSDLSYHIVTPCVCDFMDFYSFFERHQKRISSRRMTVFLNRFFTHL